MNQYIISCCSTSDLTKEHYDARKIQVIPFHYMINGISYSDDQGKTIPYEQFYHMMEEGAMTSTSQVNTDEFINFFEPFLRSGYDILHVSLSSGISGVFNAACSARDQLSQIYKDRKIFIVDSLGASSGYGLLMDKLADLRDEGKSIDEVYSFAEQHKLELHHWFFSTDLKYYVRGGRISKTSGFFGQILQICPLLNMDNQGKLVPRQKLRTKKKVILEIVHKMEEHAKDGLAYNGKCYICQAACMEDAKAVAELVETRFPSLNGKVEINWTGTTIGSHTGPNTLALFFWGDKRED